MKKISQPSTTTVLPGENPAGGGRRLALVLLLVATIAAPCAHAAVTAVPWTAAVETNNARLIGQGLPAEDLTDLTQAMVAAGLIEEDIIRLQQQLASALQHDLPLSPLTDKIREGLAKHAAPASIEQALIRVANRYRQAGQLASSLPGDQENVVMWQDLLATANAAGLSFTDLADLLRLIKQRPNRPGKTEERRLVTASLMAARDMARLTITGDDILAMVDLAVTNQFSAGEIEEFSLIIAGQMQHQSPASLISQCRAALAQENSVAQCLRMLAGGATDGTASRQGGPSSPSTSSEDDGNGKGRGNGNGSGQGGGGGKGGGGNGGGKGR